MTTDRGSLHRTDDDLDRPVVLAVLCPAGHPSPPHAGRCRICGREIPPQQPFPMPRPPLGVLRISTGGVVPLDRGVLLGRAPRVNEELPADQRPHLLRVGGPDRDISRNHAEVVLEGWHVLVRDLGSTNGTTVTLPGQEPVRLRPTEDQGIEPGAVDHARRRGLAHLRGRGVSAADAPRIPGLEVVRPLGSGGYADVFLYEQQSRGCRSRSRCSSARASPPPSAGSSSTRPTRWPSSPTTPTSCRSSAPSRPPTAGPTSS